MDVPRQPRRATVDTRGDGPAPRGRGHPDPRKLELTELGLDSAITVYAGGAACTLREEGNGAELFLVTSTGARVMQTERLTAATRTRTLTVGRDTTNVTCTLGTTRLSLRHDLRAWPGELMLEGLNTTLRLLHVVVQP